eukprot:Lithocolla_globosa_v1_NODE_1325_length_2669_cov_32.932288.p3 type:complete len:112 gc:universal NODE_1325_length_2669_cov_32.932288:809-474(-)
MTLRVMLTPPSFIKCSPVSKRHFFLSLMVVDLTFRRGERNRLLIKVVFPKPLSPAINKLNCQPFLCPSRTFWSNNCSSPTPSAWNSLSGTVSSQTLMSDLISNRLSLSYQK